MCILFLLKEKDRYGYHLIRDVSEFFEIADGTVYPLLKRLHAGGSVSIYFQESNEGPVRKYYTLTTKGKSILDTLIIEWLEFSHSVNELLERNQSNEDF